MEIKEAVAMLKNDYVNATKKMIWADLGCGSGTFTLALAAMFVPDSLVYAIDTNAASLQQIPSGYFL